MNLGEIADIRSGLVLSRKQARADSPQAIRYHQLSLRAVKAEGEIDPAELEPYFAKEPLSMDYLTQPNDIVVRLTAPYTAVLIDDTTRNLVITSNFVVIRIRGTELVPGYLYWYLNTPKADLSKYHQKYDQLRKRKVFLPLGASAAIAGNTTPDGSASLASTAGTTPSA